ncbi:MAG TPA: hypothetical protein VGG40_11090 [Solirubrobacterales bacterium]
MEIAFDAIEPPVDLFEPLVDSIKPLVDLVEAFIEAGVGPFALHGARLGMQT